MLEQATAFTLLVLYVATHVASFGHAHASTMKPDGHDARPHFHEHDHDHEHGHGDHGAHHHGESHDEGDETGLRSNDGPHDRDAVYFGDAGAVPAADRTSAVDGIKPLVALAHECTAVVSVELTPPEAVAEPPPDPLVFGPTLFLRLLSLRI